MATTVIPEDLKYTNEHEWIARTGADTVRLGITDFAQTQLGDVVFVQLPEPGEQVSAGQTIGEVESTKSVSDLFSPLDGEVVARNENLDQQPELVNAEPYGDGWMIELRVADAAAVDGLLDAQAYQKLTEQG
ncbi:MAG TPA: glycine cleavage system protein GcvH [Pseudonocardiaceae bacterium]|jgi:glycine cleavage system H protein|nr:glycine cleavage system protein GcvH [Pseudonocardiaceae bacterium]